LFGTVFLLAEGWPVGARVLLIEDNPANVQLMTCLLSPYGHTLLYAEDGPKGLKAARWDHPDLIICDLQLPEMAGYEVACWLKREARLRTIPLVAVTGQPAVGDRVLAAGFDGYLARPIDPDTFVRQVEAYLQPGTIPPLAGRPSGVDSYS